VVKKERDTRWLRTSVKNACARTDIRRNNLPAAAIPYVIHGHRPIAGAIPVIHGIL
jgi:hypothetical protein